MPQGDSSRPITRNQARKDGRLKRELESSFDEGMKTGGTPTKKRRTDVATGYNPIDRAEANRIKNKAWEVFRNQGGISEMDLGRFTDSETKRFITQLKKIKKSDLNSNEVSKLWSTIGNAARTNKSLREALIYIANVPIEDKDYLTKAFNANANKTTRDSATDE